MKRVVLYTDYNSFDYFGIYGIDTNELLGFAYKLSDKELWVIIYRGKNLEFEKLEHIYQYFSNIKLLNLNPNKILSDDVTFYDCITVYTKNEKFLGIVYYNNQSHNWVFRDIAKHYSSVFSSLKIIIEKNPDYYFYLLGS
jgi:hypothetical protein